MLGEITAVIRVVVGQRVQVQRVAANLGLGLGGFAGGTLVTASRPGSFTALFLLNAATFVVYIGFVRGICVDQPVASRPRGIGYRAVAGDGVFVRLAALNVAFVAGAVALLASMLPVYARNFGGLGERTIGALFLLNSLLIAVAVGALITLGPLALSLQSG